MAGKKKKKPKKNKQKPVDDKFTSTTSSAKAAITLDRSSSDDEYLIRQLESGTNIACTSSSSPSSSRGNVRRATTVLKPTAESKPSSPSNKKQQEFTEAAASLRKKKGYYLSPETMFPFMSGIATGARQVTQICESMKVFKFMLLDGELRVVITVLLDCMKMLQEDYQFMLEGLIGAVGVYVPDTIDVRLAASEFVNQYVLPLPSVQQVEDGDPPFLPRQSSDLRTSASFSDQILSTSTSVERNSSIGSVSSNPRQSRLRSGRRGSSRSSTSRSSGAAQQIQEEMVEPLLASINVAICILYVLEEWMQQAETKLESEELKEWVSEVLHLMRENKETNEKAEELVLRRGIQSAGSSFSVNTIKGSSNARRILRLLDFFRWMATR